MIENSTDVFHIKCSMCSKMKCRDDSRWTNHTSTITYHTQRSWICILQMRSLFLYSRSLYYLHQITATPFAGVGIVMPHPATFYHICVLLKLFMAQSHAWKVLCGWVTGRQETNGFWALGSLFIESTEHIWCETAWRKTHSVRIYLGRNCY